MKKASEYRLHAKACRALAAKTDPGDMREQLLVMAASWDQLAAERAALISRHPELALEGECEEQGALRTAP